MLDEGTLRERFPEIAWDQPLFVRVMDDTTGYYVCRYCISLFGMKATALSEGRVPFAFETQPEALDHIEAVHHD